MENKKLDELKAYLGKTERLKHAVTLLYWDMETAVPKEGFDGHSDSLTELSTMVFERSVAPEFKAMLKELNEKEEYDKLDDLWKFVVKKMYKDIERDEKIPADFYEAFVREQSEAGRAWVDAKKAADFSIFAPHLEKLIEMTKQKYAYTDPDKEIYDAMLSNYEEGMDSATVDRLFNALKAELVPLIKEIEKNQKPHDPKFKRYFDPDAQKKMQKLLLEYIGFNFDKGTVGESEHPFTTNFSSKDVRVTNHYHENDVMCSAYSAIHEGGHAIFEQNVNPAYDGTVAGSCRHMGIHESQSRFYENILGRRKSFWTPIFADVQKLFPNLSDVTLDEFVAEAAYVERSLIRTDADEVTYGLHVIIRYEIEKAIFREGAKVADLPAMWNSKMEEYLGITPENDAVGILQDMHWSDASFGYFPTYLLGTIYDGMYVETIEKELGDIDEILAKGEIKKITKWLNEKIHIYGSTRNPKEVIAAVCGKEVSAEPIIKYFKEKYTK